MSPTPDPNDELAEARRDRLERISESAETARGKLRVADYLAAAVPGRNRRILWTTLSLLAFVMTMVHAYRVGAGFEDAFIDGWEKYARQVGFELTLESWYWHLLMFAVLCAALPTILLSLSVGNAVLGMRFVFVRWAAALMVLCAALACYLGFVDFSPFGGVEGVSWWILVPLIVIPIWLVIRGARRQAAMDIRTDRDTW